MTFGEKLKKLRSDNGMTQEELAERIFVTRTAISKWETDNGYPSIDSLKELSKLFGVSVDELISDNDIEKKKQLDEKKSRRFHWIAVACLGATVLFALLALSFPKSYLGFLSSISAVLCVVFSFLSKAKDKRIPQKRIVWSIIARIVALVVVVSVVAYTLVTM